MTDTLPEGTDHIIAGASAAATSLRERAAARAGEVKDQVGDKALAFAETGKVRASGALDEVARMIGDTAGRIDEQIGAGYGDYARRAAEAVAGASASLRDRNVDELIEGARDLVRKSPAIAIAGAAVAGFALARLLKAGGTAAETAAKAAPVSLEVSKAARKAPAKPRAKAKPATKA
ncbi:MAG TPA: hypothetical protein VGC10_10310 [Sphingomonas sp.]